MKTNLKPFDQKTLRCVHELTIENVNQVTLSMQRSASLIIVRIVLPNSLLIQKKSLRKNVLC